MKNCPDRLERRIAGMAKSRGRFAVDAGGEQQVYSREDGIKLRAAVIGSLNGINIIFDACLKTLLNASLQLLADQLSVALPLRSHALRTFVAIDDFARGSLQPR